ncbi:hypothetical protein GCM10022289_45130 [Pedobacter jeongneungensis]|uniref:HTH araC/xylS-type domain-containing protein n=1 Tax=Pedobacter jeongneungensis TaxID=947309 RepID=A0ABP8BQ58_9SPHI
MEEKAKAAGGYVHVILGNHDIMNLSGDFRHVDRKYMRIAESLGLDYIRLFDEDTELGRWLRTKNVVERVGDYLFVHGGISPEVLKLDLSLQQLNDIARPYYGVAKKELPVSVRPIFGKGVFGVVIDRMMLEAEVLLLETTVAIKEVAYELGFSELSYFLTYFKRVKGVNPVEFRRLGKKG